MVLFGGGVWRVLVVVVVVIVVLERCGWLLLFPDDEAVVWFARCLGKEMVSVWSLVALQSVSWIGGPGTSRWLLAAASCAGQVLFHSLA